MEKVDDVDDVIVIGGGIVGTSPPNTSVSCIAMASGMPAAALAPNSELRITPDFMSMRVSNATRVSLRA